MNFKLGLVEIDLWGLRFDEPSTQKSIFTFLTDEILREFKASSNFIFSDDFPNESKLISF